MFLKGGGVYSGRGGYSGVGEIFCRREFFFGGGIFWRGNSLAGRVGGISIIQ